MSESDESVNGEIILEAPLPQPGVKVFQSGDNPEALGWTRSFGTLEAWSKHASGYRLAADQLVRDILERRVHPVDELVHPIPFLYRHYLELQLKGLYLLVCVFREVTPERFTRHSLVGLWEKVRPDLEDIMAAALTKEICDAVQEKFIQFDEIDRQSDAFRYPIDTSGDPTLGSVECTSAE
jgi:hypothetical protein